MSQQEQLFSLKEWMAEISRKLDRVDVKLDGKADAQHVMQIDSRLAEVEKATAAAVAERGYLIPQHMGLLTDVGILKEKVARSNGIEGYKRWVYGSGIASVAAAVLAVLALVKF